MKLLILIIVVVIIIGCIIESAVMINKTTKYLIDNNIVSGEYFSPEIIENEEIENESVEVPIHISELIDSLYNQMNVYSDIVKDLEFKESITLNKENKLKIAKKIVDYNVKIANIQKKIHKLNEELSLFIN